MIGYYDIMKDLNNAFKGVADKVYVQDRPKSVPTRLSSFIVVSLPVTLYNKTYGNASEYDWINSYCRVEIYVRDVKGAVDIKKMDSISNAAMEIFPIKGNVCLASRPRMVLSNCDEHDFHVSTIQASISTLV